VNNNNNNALDVLRCLDWPMWKGCHKDILYPT
jgi:hypothetical protein